MIVVTTSTGNIGSRVVDRLFAVNEVVTLLAREPNKLSEEVRLWTEVRQGSTADAEFMKRVCKGASALFLCIPPAFDAPDTYKWYRSFASAAIAAIKENEIAYVVFVSSGGKGINNAGPVSCLHEIEESLAETGAHVAFLRAGYFMENFHGFIESIEHYGAIYASFPGDLPIPMVATADIGDKAAELLIDRRWRGRKVVPVHGAADISMKCAAQILSAEIGKEIHFVTVPPVTIKEYFLSKGMSKNVADEHLKMFAAFAANSFYSAEPRTPESTTATTFSQWTKEKFAPLFSRPAAQTVFSRKAGKPETTA